MERRRERQWIALPVRGLEISAKPFCGKKETSGFGWSERRRNPFGVGSAGGHESVERFWRERRRGEGVAGFGRSAGIFLHHLASSSFIWRGVRRARIHQTPCSKRGAELHAKRAVAGQWDG